jgi:hypothetical protein
VESLLNAEVDLVTGARGPRGCLFVQGALSGGEAAASARKELASRRATAEAELRRRLQRARNEGDLPASAEPADLARYICTILQGLAVQAAGGATRAQLRRVVQTALAAWPT